MLTNRDFICFGDDWGRHPQTLEHLVRLLAKKNKVIWVNSFGHKKPQISRKVILRIFEKVKTAFRGDKNPEPNIKLVSPLILPFHNFLFIRKLNGWLISFVLKRAMRGLGISKPILMTNSPVTMEVFGKVGESLRVYYCLDDYTAFEGNIHNMAEIEKDALKQVDVAFFISQKLFNEKDEKPSRSYIISQGIDFEHFNESNDMHVNPLQKFNHPIIGFVGLIENWVDLRMVADIAITHPNWSFVFIGPALVDLSPYQGIPNLTFLGKVPYSELPNYLKNFDIGLIPFKINNLTLAANPLKLMEYFCLGLPVVSTDLPEVAKFRPLVSIAKGTDGFILAIDQLLENSNEEIRLQRIALAKQFSWERLLNEQTNIIAQAELIMTQRIVSEKN